MTETKNLGKNEFEETKIFVRMNFRNWCAFPFLCSRLQLHIPIWLLNA